jgi:predicted  nucleic acid-binding Zn-ribbon protein
MPDGHRLLALQELDTTLDQLQHQRPRLAEVVARSAADAAVAEVTAEIARWRAEAADAEAAIAAAEQQAGVLTTKRTRLEQQLKTVIAPREAEALMHEIELLTAQRGELDDAELAALERQGEAEGQIAAATAQLADRQAEQLVAAEAQAKAWQALDERIAALQQQRDALAAELPAADVQVYDSARQRFGGVGVAHLDGLRCSGCHLDLSRGEVDVIRATPADELAECPQCNRYLVR